MPSRALVDEAQLLHAVLPRMYCVLNGSQKIKTQVGASMWGPD
jgi:hypothetical protein